MSSYAHSPAETKVPASVDTAYLRYRMGSFLAVAPLGVWVLIHLWNNLSAYQSGDAWQRSVTDHQHPVGTAVITLIVLAPLLMHTLWGIGRMASGRPNNGSYGYYGNLKYLLQRISAVGVLLFLGAHVWLAFLHPRMVEGHPEQFAEFANEMRHNLPTLPVYLLGTLGVAYHLGNGISNLAMGWGLAPSAKGMARFEILAITIFLITLAMAWGALYAVWSAGAIQ